MKFRQAIHDLRKHVEALQAAQRQEQHPLAELLTLAPEDFDAGGELFNATRLAGATAAYETAQSLADTDLSRAVRLMRDAVDLGSPPAAHWLARALTDKDDRSAQPYWQKAAEGGIGDASYYLGTRLHRSDSAAAERHYRDALADGCRAAAFNLALLVDARDPAAAEVDQLLRIAAREGNADAASVLAGRLVGSCWPEARDYARQAAEAGGAQRAYAYSSMLAHDGDLPASELWLQRAAEQGHHEASAALAGKQTTTAPEATP